MRSTNIWARLADYFWADPLLALGVGAALVALATTPIAFAVLGRLRWFEARRGRVMLQPAFASVVAGMMLVMVIPAIFTALVIKSQHFDERRYEFNPNTTWTPLAQGRAYETLKEADLAVKAKMESLALERKNLVEGIKKLDEAMLGLRAVAGTSPAVAQAVPGVLESLATLRRGLGVDAPQQLMDFTAPPAAIAGVGTAPTPTLAPTVAAAPAAPTGGGLAPAQAEAEVAAVPVPQRSLAAMLPLVDLPPGWTLGKSGPKHVETFNAENLFEKINGRAESFIQYGVRGMAYAYYHPLGDESNDVQLYIFELADPLKALGKYGAEKPESVTPIEVGAEGYTTAGSTLFYSGRYYTQIVSTRDDAKFGAFAKALADRVAAAQRPGAAPAVAAASAAPVAAAAPPPPAEGTPEAMFALLPKEPGRSGAKYVAQDVFGYSFLVDVFMADYREGEVNWQGFLRPYADPAAARAVYDAYLDGAKQDGAEVRAVEAEGADAMVISSNIGLIDVVFLKGNTLAGANGATEAAPAEAFARALAKSLPPKVAPIPASPPAEGGKPAGPEGR